MFFLRRRRTEVRRIGVHVGPDDVRLVRVSDPASRTPIVTAQQRLVFPADVGADPLARSAAAAPVVRQARRSGCFAGGRLVTHLPPEYLYIRTFRSAAPDSADADVHRQALEGAPFGGGEAAQVRAVPVGRVRQGRDVRTEYLATTARDADVRAFLERFGGDISVESLRAEPFAIYAAAARSAKVGPATHAVLHVGKRETLVLIGSGDKLFVLRRVIVGGEQFDRAVARRLGVDIPEARMLRTRATDQRSDPVGGVVANAVRPLVEQLVGEAVACLRYHAVTFRAPPPGCVRLLGSESSDPHLRAMLASATGLPVEGLGVVEGLCDDDGEWAGALGLALSAAAAPSATAVHVVGEAACA